MNDIFTLTGQIALKNSVNKILGEICILLFVDLSVGTDKVPGAGIDQQVFGKAEKKRL